ncbi:MAG: beta-ketoacyl-acyl-carrier-protein synthase [Chloroflexi bacterium]|nr:beta-ketoacyl-acyl-carrier-protein synthase [Chloroflexota bacterium]
MAKRVVITGMGMISPVGNSVEESWANLVAGKTGIGRITLFDTTGFDTQIGGEVKNFKPEEFGVDKKDARRMDRYAQFAVAASVEAIKSSNFKITDENRNRVGVVIGTGIGGIGVLSEQLKVLYEKGPSRVNPFLIPMMIPNMASGHVALKFGARGTNFCVVSACSTGAHAIGEGVEIIKRGEADVMIVGGSEAPLVPISVAGFNSMKALSTNNDEPEKASRPFDAKRDGFVMGEGAGVVILEDLDHALERGAMIYAEVTGYGSTDDANHIVQPEEGGEGATRAMKLAMKQAGLTPRDIDYINAHGTSTKLNEDSETAAIKGAMGDLAYEVSISSTKSMTGHLLGAAGAIEAIISVKSINEGIIPPTINYENPDPKCDLDVTPNQAKKKDVRNAMSNSFGFGGHNVSLIFSRYEK